MQNKKYFIKQIKKTARAKKIRRTKPQLIALVISHFALSLSLLLTRKRPKILFDAILIGCGWFYTVIQYI